MGTSKAPECSAGIAAAPPRCRLCCRVVIAPQELKELQRDENPDLVAEANEDNIFEWHFAIRGAWDTEFEVRLRGGSGAEGGGEQRRAMGVESGRAAPPPVRSAAGAGSGTGSSHPKVG